MRILFIFFIFVIGNANACNNNVSLTEWQRDKIAQLVFYRCGIKTVWDGWIGFEKITEDKLPILVHFPDNKRLKYEYDIEKNILSRFDPVSGTFCAIVEKYRDY